MHGHTALFGVYGMLGIGLLLFCLRAYKPGLVWKNWPLRTAFWAINGGLALMVVISLLPIGLLQTFAAIEQGTWWARSAEFMRTPLMDVLRWLRAPERKRQVLPAASSLGSCSCSSDRRDGAGAGTNGRKPSGASPVSCLRQSE